MKILSVRVKPNSKQQIVRHEEDGSVLVQLTSAPVGGKGNQELIQLLAKEFGVFKSAIRVKSGAASRNKLIELNS